MVFKKNKPLAISKGDPITAPLQNFSEMAKLAGDWCCIFGVKQLLTRYLMSSNTCWNVNHKKWDQIEHR